MQTIFWVLLGNAIRLVAVVVLADNVDRWYATGTGHELLGIVAFVFILGMVISTDALLTILIYGPSAEGLDESLDPPSFGASAEGMPIFPLRPHAVWLLVGTLSMIGIVGLRVASVHRHGLQSLNLAALPIIPNPVEGDLPPTLNGWQRVSFEHVERTVSTTTLAKDSFVWKYTNGNSAVVISVDCPWAEWHNLNVCYAALGWETDAKYFIPNARQVPDKGKRETQSELVMTKADRTGFVIFTVVDRNGQELSPTRHLEIQSPVAFARALLQEATASLGFGLEAQFEVVGLQLPATTIQMLTESPESLTGPQLDELRVLYNQVRHDLLKSRRWTSSQTSAATP